MESAYAFKGLIKLATWVSNLEAEMTALLFMPFAYFRSPGNMPIPSAE
jgi:hypothetical protein